MPNIDEKIKAFRRLIEIMDELREKCPWDRKQTFHSLRKMTIEETYELTDAILEEDNEDIKKELGDLLLHIVFYSKIASEKAAFDLEDVINSLCEKLIYRHPHIYGDAVAKTPHQVEQNWEALKLKEKGGNKSVLEGVPVSLPALIKANRIQEKVSGVGFDWKERREVWNKVREEIQEFETEIEKDNQDKMEAECGDLLFALVNAARLYNIDPETALERTNKKFTKRFNYIESQTIKKGIQLKDMPIEEMDILWGEAKELENKE